MSTSNENKKLDQILVVGLNSALQRVIKVPNLHINEVNRARSVRVGTGGKGQNFVFAISQMSPSLRPCLLQFIGSCTDGDKLLQMVLPFTNEYEMNFKNTSTEVEMKTREQSLTVRVASPLSNLCDDH